MKKVANTKTAAELFLYAALVVMGASIVFNPWIGESNPLLYIAVMFIIFAFFAFFAYFIGKEDGDYELLLLSLVNVVMAILIFYFKNGNLPVLLSFTLSAWSFFYISLKLIIAFQYKEIDYKKYIVKNFVTVVILLLSAVTIFRLFNDDIILVLTLYGYYFIIVAALNFLEVCLCKVTFDADDSHTFRLMPSSFDITREETSAKPAKVLVEEKSVVANKKTTVKKKVSTPKKKVAVSSAAKKTVTKKPATKKVAKNPAPKKVATKTTTPKKNATKSGTTKKATKKKAK